MPCVSVRHNRARKATVRAANAERKNKRKAVKAEQKSKRKATRILKKQQAAQSAPKVAQVPTQGQGQAKTQAPVQVLTEKTPATFKIPHDSARAKGGAKAPAVEKAANETFMMPGTSAKSGVHQADLGGHQSGSEEHRTTKGGAKSPLKLKGAAKSAPKPAPKVITPLRRTAFMTRDALINAESRLGSTIFGPIPEGHRREFFHDQQNIWIWFESWHDETGHQHQLTVRYEVRPSGVYKKVSAGKYFKLAGEELENFRRATHAYLHIVKKYLYPHRAK